MRNYILLFFLLTVGQYLIGQNVNSQNNAHHQTQWIVDSLGLNETMKKKLFKVNLDIELELEQLMKNTANRDSLRVLIRGVEQKRLSGYSRVLGNELYNLYLEKNLNRLKNSARKEQ
ncbi:hypothetical protein [Gynurincola endophyticus]|uniref:hypothetical protein n=1 Tax=Gynurincola endophyticus TaxID=2479004 RepID=UPI000F8EE9C9|nr:hypothetical protein [Gynurincola endophyticus]